MGVRGGDILEDEAGRAEEKEEVSLPSLFAFLFSVFPKKRLILRLQISFLFKLIVLRKNYRSKT